MKMQIYKPDKWTQQGAVRVFLSIYSVVWLKSYICKQGRRNYGRKLCTKWLSWILDYRKSQERLFSWLGYCEMMWEPKFPRCVVMNWRYIQPNSSYDSIARAQLSRMLYLGAKPKSLRALLMSKLRFFSKKSTRRRCIGGSMPSGF